MNKANYKKGIYVLYVKRPMDFILAFLALIVLIPVLLSIAILVRIKLGSPIFFKQERPGLNGNLFIMYKFRTMTNEKDSEGNLLSDDIRLTKFGKFLRSTSLDELPELWNIIKGDMSIVGPRPLLVQYLPLYNDFQKQRHDTLPGLTGLAQVNGRNNLSWSEKFEWDIRYVNNVTFSGDVSIFFKTIISVFKQKGISSNTSVTMDSFLGNEEVKHEKR